MDKKEKYINFIVDDLIKKTEIDYEQGKIKLTYHSHLLSTPSTLLYLSYTPSLFFSNHVRKVYGAHSEEIEFIWDLYKQRIKELIDNE